MMIVIANFVRTSQVADGTNIDGLTISGEPGVAHYEIYDMIALHSLMFDIRRRQRYQIELLDVWTLAPMLDFLY
jgi:hypothetical protein